MLFRGINVPCGTVLSYTTAHRKPTNAAPPDTAALAAWSRAQAACLAAYRWATPDAGANPAHLGRRELALEAETAEGTVALAEKSARSAGFTHMAPPSRIGGDG